MYYVWSGLKKKEKKTYRLKIIACSMFVSFFNFIILPRFRFDRLTLVACQIFHYISTLLQFHQINIISPYDALFKHVSIQWFCYENVSCGLMKFFFLSTFREIIFSAWNRVNRTITLRVFPRRFIERGTNVHLMTSTPSRKMKKKQNETETIPSAEWYQSKSGKCSQINLRMIGGMLKWFEVLFFFNIFFSFRILYESHIPYRCIKYSSQPDTLTIRWYTSS